MNPDTGADLRLPNLPALDPTRGSFGTLDEPDECVGCGRLTNRAEGELCYPLCLDCEITARIELGVAR